MGGPAAIVTNCLQKRLAYDPDAFELVSLVAYTPNILLANPQRRSRPLPSRSPTPAADPGKSTCARACPYRLRLGSGESSASKPKWAT